MGLFLHKKLQSPNKNHLFFSNIILLWFFVRLQPLLRLSSLPAFWSIKKRTSHHLVTHKNSDWAAAEAPDVGRCCHSCFTAPPEQVVKGSAVTGRCRGRCRWCKWTECHCRAQRPPQPAVTSCDTQRTLRTRVVFEILQISHTRQCYCSAIADCLDWILWRLWFGEKWCIESRKS